MKYIRLNKTKFKFIIFFILIVLFINDNIKVMYYISNNLGDYLNYVLLSKLVDKKIFFYSTSKKKGLISNDIRNINKLNEVAKTDLLFIGSILNILSNWTYIFFNKKDKYETILSNFIFKIYDYFYPLKIYGTGFIAQQYKKESYIRNIKLIAVRGNITLKRLIKNGIKAPNSIILADPGILFPIILKKKIHIKKRCNLCVIPHFVDANNSLIKKNIKIKNYCLLNIKSKPQKFFTSLNECKRVLSSSLHGLIFSDSLNIPNMRMIISNKIIGGDYKFNDYYSAYGINSHFKIDLRKNIFSDNELYMIDHNYKINYNMIKQKQCLLILNFPYRLKKEFLYLIK